MAFAATALSFTSCSSDDEPFATASEDDFPQILLPWFGDWENGEPSEYKNITREIEYVDSVTVTPARYTTVDWYIDGKKVNTGLRYNTYFEAGNHILKIVATTTKGLSTSRTGKIIVRPVEGDPVFDDVAEERLVSPGIVSTLTGSNLKNIKKLLVGGKEAEIKSVSDNLIEYVTPATEGVQRIQVVDDKMTYGGVFTKDNRTYNNLDISITSAPYIKASELNAKPKREVELAGINLDKISSISINGQNVAIKSQSAKQLTFVCPELENDTYDFNVTTSNGTVALFNGNESCKINVASAIVLWTGSQDIMDWPLMQFDGVGAKLKELAKVGSILRLTVSPIAADYHQGNAVIDWAGIVTGGYEDARNDFQITGENQVVELVLSAKSIEMIQEKPNMFGLVGHGYKVTKISIEEPDETEIYVGPSDRINWDEGQGPKFALTFDWAWCQSKGIEPGMTIKAYVTAEEGAIGAIATSWWNKINDGSGWESDSDIKIKTDLSAGENVLEYTVNTTSFMTQQGLGIIGHGFVVNKITLVKQ